MKKMNSLKLALTFAGCFLGAGYISGQELWQFFGNFGAIGFLGIVLAAVLLTVFGIMLISLTDLTGTTEMDAILFPKGKKAVRNIFSFVELFFLTGIYVIMAAGAGALFGRMLSLPDYIGSIIFCTAVAATSIFGIKGMVSAFSVTVPLLVSAAIIIFAVTARRNGISIPKGNAAVNDNPLISNWLISAFVYVSYNLFSSIGIISPLGSSVKNKRTVFWGISGGSVLLLLIAVSVLLSINIYPSTASAELPMLEIAFKTGKAASYIFAILLFLGMYGTSVSSVFAIDEFIRLKYKTNKKHSVMLISSVSTFALLTSLLGFGRLIGIIYPVCGYLGAAALILITVRFISEKRKAREPSR